MELHFWTWEHAERERSLLAEMLRFHMHVGWLRMISRREKVTPKVFQELYRHGYVRKGLLGWKFTERGKQLLDWKLPRLQEIQKELDQLGKIKPSKNRPPMEDTMAQDEGQYHSEKDTPPAAPRVLPYHQYRAALARIVQGQEDPLRPELEKAGYLFNGQLTVPGRALLSLRLLSDQGSLVGKK